MMKQEYWTYFILAIPIVLLSIFLVYPVVSVIVYGLISGTGSSFVETISAYYTQFTIAFTLVQASISTILALLVGLPGGILLARLKFRGKSLIRALIIVPFVLPPIVVVVGFLQMFGSFGIIDSLLMIITQSTTSILNLADGFVGIVLAHTFYNAPLVMLLVSASMERLNPEIEESAEILGANSVARFKKITLPHIIPALSAS
ncbi:MAG: iron ABC transporter permease, partial [Candidatus Thorarchaeota archaeon]|nr:iron ABC transporter permease [Candidatus Thorarchaeota archaeon]